jgi:hypothetical protein
MKLFFRKNVIADKNVGATYANIPGIPYRGENLNFHPYRVYLA